jgi:hypothetical protein
LVVFLLPGIFFLRSTSKVDMLLFHERSIVAFSEFGLDG